MGRGGLAQGRGRKHGSPLRPHPKQGSSHPLEELEGGGSLPEVAADSTGPPSFFPSTHSKAAVDARGWAPEIVGCRREGPSEGTSDGLVVFHIVS